MSMSFKERVLVILIVIKLIHINRSDIDDIETGATNHGKEKNAGGGPVKEKQKRKSNDQVNPLLQTSKPIPTSSSSKSVDEMPPALEGWLEKKANSKFKGWNRRYCRVNEINGTFAYFQTAKENEVPSGVMDLRIIQVTPDKDNKRDNTRFTIDMGDTTYNFKAASVAEAFRWIKGLDDWKEYFLMQM